MANTAVPPSPAGSLIGGTPPSTPMPAVAVSGGGFVNSSLYVGDLAVTVDENRLYDLFSQVAPVISVRICRDLNRRFSLGYGYVNFTTPHDASYARDTLNFSVIDGKPIRIMFSHRDPLLRKSGYANLFIKNLDSSIDNKSLLETFATFGTVLSCKVALDRDGQSKGYGFVQFDKEEAAQTAIKRLNGMLINDKKVFVGVFVRRQERNHGSPKFTNVYVKNLPASIGDEELKALFGKFGAITSSIVMKDSNGNSRCFGFVNFENSDDAATSVENLNESTVDDKVLYVGKAEKKSKREAELKAKYEQEKNSRYEKLKGANLYLKNLDDDINEDKLEEIFSEFGTITSCKVMLDQNGLSKCAGFVAFSSPDEATHALNETNGKMIGRKPLYVAIAQRKDERRSWLQAHFATARTPGSMSPMTGVAGIHPTALPRLVQQQICFGQVGSGLIPQGGYGFPQQQNFTNIPPNFVMPMQIQQQGQQRPHQAGSRRGAYSHPPQTQPQQHNLNQGLSQYVANARNGVNPSPSLVPVPVASLDLPHIVRPIPRSSLASDMASASPENQRRMLGEQLYPLVERIEPNYAGKVTGMLLEMDQTEVLHLIDSPDALTKKVGEAVEVLQLAASTGDGF